MEFHPGLTLVVGANGLGKTTLVTLLFRLISGPYDIRHFSGGNALGSRRLEASAISAHERKLFGARVSDRAADASARLDLTLGSTSVTVERRLADLSLHTAQVGDTVCTDESTFQSLTTRAAGLGSFGDFLLVLRYLVFYFEDRRQLVWDPSAQRQLLRVLFLPPDVAQRWTEMERAILEKDSRMRNLRAVVGSEQTVFAKSLAKQRDAASLRAELDTLESLQDPDRFRLAQLASLTTELDRNRQDARLAHLRAKQEREARYRGLEHATFIAIDARFPSQGQTARYMLTHLLSENTCLVCGSQEPGSAQQYLDRIDAGRCVVCDVPLSASDQIIEAREVADARVSQTQHDFSAAERELLGAARNREDAETSFSRHVTEMTQLHSEIATRSARIDEIAQLLPPSEGTLRKQRDELASMRSRLEMMRAELTRERAAFRSLIEQCTDDLLSSSEEIVTTFNGFATNFLSEQVSLTWQPRPATVGQGGRAVLFPSFGLDMSGSDFGVPVRRSGPNDVSESQREFIDLAFRMALMRTAGSGAVGLVVDAPEASLDAVFARRAGETLLRFGAKSGSTVVVTSNLLEGNLLPTLIAGIAATAERRSRLVDLFEVARPTAAVEAERTAYDALRRTVFGPVL